MQVLNKINVKDLKSGGVKGAPFAQIVDRRLDTEQLEKDIFDEEKVKRGWESQNYFKPGYQEGSGGQIYGLHPQYIEKKGALVQHP